MHVSAKRLAKEWGVDFSHAVYHRKGAWFHLLTSFPGALFDPEGFVAFNNEGEYRSCSFLRLNKHCHCPGGISGIPAYQRFRSLLASDLAEAPLPARVPTTVSRIIRDTSLSMALKRIYEHQCQVCGVVLELPNGRYSEAHHLQPLGSPHCGPDCRENLIVVCPTCHVKLDYFGIVLSRDLLLIQLHHIADAFIDYHNSHALKCPLGDVKADERP